MAIVGSAYIIVRAITRGIDKDIKKSLRGVGDIGESIGEDISRNISKGMSSGKGGGFDIGRIFSAREIDDASEKFKRLTRAGYFLSPIISAVSSVIGVLITGLISLGSVVIAAAIPAVMNLAGALGALIAAAIVGKVAFGGVAEAIALGNKVIKVSIKDVRALAKAELALGRADADLAILLRNQQLQEARSIRNLIDLDYAYAKAVKAAQYALRELAFDSEDATIKQKKAAIDLEKARETLARVSDLPPNSRARKEAELAFAEADLNYRRSIEANNKLKEQEAVNAKLGPDFDKQVDGQEEVVRATRDIDDAEKELKKSREDNAEQYRRAAEDLKIQAADVQALKDKADATDAYKDALAGLSKEAQEFVKYMVSIQPALAKLKEAAGALLFPALTAAMKLLVDELFPAILPLIKDTGGKLGEFAKKIAEVLTSTAGLERIKTIWKGINDQLGNLSDAAANVLDSILLLWAELTPDITEFTKKIKEITAGWKESLEAAKKSGKLREDLDKLKNTAKDLGIVLGNTFKGLWKLLMNNIGPGSGGQIFLDYLKDISEKFKNLTTIDGKPVKEFFADAAENGVKLLELIGKILFAFMRLADNEGFGEFLDSMKDATDIFSAIGEDMDKGLGAFGEFIESFAKFTQHVVDGEAVKIFFTVLRVALDGINAALDSPVGKAFLAVSNKILPVIAALVLILEVMYFTMKVSIAYWGHLKTALTFVKVAFVQLGVAARAAWAFVMGPVGLILIAIALVVAATVLLYQKNEKFREIVDNVWGKVKDAISAVWDWIKNNWPMLLSMLAGPFGLLVFAIVKNWDSIIAFVKGVPTKIKEAGSKMWSWIKADLADSWKVIQEWWDISVIGRVKGWGTAIKNAAAGMWDGLKSGLSAVVNSIIDRINYVISLINKLKIPSFGVGKFKTPEIGFNIKTLPPVNFADGGVVSPRSGGLLARIGEAGRPERVEPLDPDGLSKRDKAMIQLLSGGNGKGVTVNVYPSAGMDERELAAMVSRQITYAIRSGGS